MRGPVAVTGATGFIGTHLVERLVALEIPVRAFVRDPDRMAPALRGKVDLVVGTLAQSGPLRELMAGAGTLIHVAGLASAWAPRADDYFSVNVEGVRNVLNAAEHAGVGRIVHMSTVLTRFPPEQHPTPYVASKRQGEQVVREHVAAGGDAVIVQPARVYGPGPLNDANGSTKLIHSLLRGPLCVRLADGGVRASWVHVDDVVEGTLLAARRGEAGGTYILGGDLASVEELLHLAGEIAGVSRGCLAVPPAAAMVVAGIFEIGGRLGLPVLISRGWVRSFLADQTVDIGPTREALGYQPRPLREGLAQTIAWLESRKGDS